MSELKWNWVYYPYLDAPNEQEESALKAGYIKVVIKDEADKVIAELKDKVLQYKVLYKELCRDINTQERHFALQVNYQKYKRCLTMYRYCAIKALYELDFKGNDVEWKWYSKWMHKWFKLAEKFKPNNSTAQ